MAQNTTQKPENPKQEIERLYTPQLATDIIFQNKTVLSVEEVEEILKRRDFLACKTPDAFHFSKLLSQDGQKKTVSKDYCLNILAYFNPLISWTKYKDRQKAAGWRGPDIQRLVKSTWFLGDMTPTAAENYLQNQPEGTFLVRFSSSKPGNFTLSLVIEKNRAIEHITIEQAVGGQVKLVESDKTFKNIFLLVEHYSTEAPIKKGISLRVFTEAMAIKGAFEVKDFIGSGEFGEVWLAALDGTRVAAKKLKDSKHLPLIQNEIKILSTINHPNVIRYYGVRVENNKQDIYIITEYYELGNLKNYFTMYQEPLEIPVKLSLFRHIVSGMIIVHRNDIIHRDLSAKNILLKMDPILTAVVSDFGLSKFMDKQIISPKFPFRWTAPEIIFNFSDKRFTKSSDVYSFGCTMYEILEDGENPFPKFSGDTELKTALQQQEPMEQLFQLKSLDTFVDLKQLMLSCVDYDPAKRPTFEQIDQILKNVDPDQLKNPDYKEGGPKRLSDNKEEYIESSHTNYTSLNTIDIRKPLPPDQNPNLNSSSTSDLRKSPPSSPPTYTSFSSEQKRKFQEDLLNHANSDNMLRQSSSLIIEHVQLDTSTQCTEQNLIEKCDLKQIPARKLAIWIQQWIHRNQQS